MPWMLLLSDHHVMHVRDKGWCCRSGFHHPLTTAIKIFSISCEYSFHGLPLGMGKLGDWGLELWCISPTMRDEIRNVYTRLENGVKIPLLLR